MRILDARRSERRKILPQAIEIVQPLESRGQGACAVTRCWSRCRASLSSVSLRSEI
jgi:hypothetical protein